MRVSLSPDSSCYLTDAQTMNKHRIGDQHEPPERIQRTYNINDLWYFELRGGGQMGPFDSEKEMLAALQEFIELNRSLSESEQAK